MSAATSAWRVTHHALRTPRRARRRSRRLLSTVRRSLRANAGLHLLGLTVLTLAVAVGTLMAPNWLPVATFTLVILLGGFVLQPRHMVLLYALVAAGVWYVHRERTAMPVSPGIVLLLVCTGVLAWFLARSRWRLGLNGTMGDSMLVDLRDRLRFQGELPSLPPGWHAEAVLRAAYAESFSGDFLVAARPGDGRHLEVALVDVSGKGAAAGTRALLLSGAFGGLLGAMPADRFLQAANSYLLRQHWDEGFATAVHLDLDLVTGSYRVTSAGHPPVAQFRAGSGRWVLGRQAGGPVLGVLDAVEFEGVTGCLGPGDALLLYTDGVVETPDRDLDTGIDRMLGQAERLVRDGFRGGAGRIVEQARAGESDDRALVLIWR